MQDSDVLETFFKKYSPENGNVPSITPPPYLTKPTDLADPMKFALPTEAEIRSMVDGSHRNSGATTITLEELLGMFNRMRGGKAGVRETRYYGCARAVPVSDANNTIDHLHSVSCMSCVLGGCMQARLEAKHERGTLGRG